RGDDSAPVSEAARLSPRRRKGALSVRPAVSSTLPQASAPWSQGRCGLMNAELRKGSCSALASAASPSTISYANDPPPSPVTLEGSSCPRVHQRAPGDHCRQAPASPVLSQRRCRHTLRRSCLTPPGEGSATRRRPQG